MRTRLAALPLLAFAAIFAAACSEPAHDAGGDDSQSPAPPDQSRAGDEATGSSSACAGRQTREIAFTGEDAADTVTIRVDAQECAEAAALVTVRGPDGALLFAEAFKLDALALTDPPSPGRLDNLLTSFTENISMRPAAELGPFEAATREGPQNPVAIRPVASRRIYERAREAGGPVLCFNIHYETAACLWHDAGRGGTFHLYYSGP